MTTQFYTQKWELDSLFKGGSSSPVLQKELHALNQELQKLKEELEQRISLTSSIRDLQRLECRYLEVDAFISCLLAQDVLDQSASQLNDWITSFKANLESVSDRLNIQLVQLTDADFDQLLKEKELQEIAFILQERRNWAKEKLPLNQENLINQLAIDGYQGWHEMYATLMGHLCISFEDRELSVGQVESQLAHPNRLTREKLFKSWSETWKSQEQVFAQILNHLAGFRVKTYAARGWSNVLKEPLFYNRMQETTLNTMWETVEQHKKPLERYLSKKAQLLGLSRLSWFDVEAPLGDSDSQFIPFQEAAETIIRQFHLFYPAMGQFAQQAFQQQWIESEDRPGKRPGGFCSQHPQSKQSRIFMTYSGNQTNVFTLAHELGHAYHNYVVRDLPILAQQYRMNVAETASTLAEMVVIDSLIKAASDPLEKQKLLDSKLQRSVIFLMNIHARFLFEKRFYQARKKEIVLASQLNHLMEEAQQEAFQGVLTDWHPHFWVAKGHFYFTDVPFYNFPYTFGYLFSLGIYAQILKEGKSFGQRYDALLQDTGCMSVETLACKHLGVDLTQPFFWQEALELIKQDVEEFMNF